MASQNVQWWEATAREQCITRWVQWFPDRWLPHCVERAALVEAGTLVLADLGPLLAAPLGPTAIVGAPQTCGALSHLTLKQDFWQPPVISAHWEPAAAHATLLASTTDFSYADGFRPPRCRRCTGTAEARIACCLWSTFITLATFCYFQGMQVTSQGSV